MNTTLHVLGYNTHLFGGTAVEIIKELKETAVDFINSISGNVIGKDATKKDAIEYYDDIRIDKIINQVKNLAPDIVGLSEVWANKSKKRFISELKSQLPYSAWDKNENSLQIGSGLLLLSRFPLSNVYFTQYPDGSLVGDDKHSQKGFILATADLGAQKLLIAHTHTQADNDQEAIEARKSNIIQLQKAISKAADNSIPAILLGDLNIIGESESGSPTDEYEFLCETLKPLQMTDSYHTLHPNATSAPGYTYDAVNNKLIAHFAPKEAEKKVQQRLDYMFVRGITPTSVTVPNSFTFQPPDGKGTTDLSDHYPLEGNFSIP